MPDQVPIHVARERNWVLRELATGKKRDFMLSFVGRDLEAITLTRFNGERTEALSDNFLQLMVEGPHPANEVYSVRVDDVHHGGLVGHVGSVT